MHLVSTDLTAHCACISVLRLSIPPVIRTEKELSDKVKLLEVSSECIWKVSASSSEFLHIDS